MNLNLLLAASAAATATASGMPAASLALKSFLRILPDGFLGMESKHRNLDSGIVPTAMMMSSVLEHDLVVATSGC
uniref:Secreted protein n=1 Tax=Oryza punctata TaxID=4537 RepID=A0A0E0JWA2_ORYPU